MIARNNSWVTLSKIGTVKNNFNNITIKYITLKIRINITVTIKKLGTFVRILAAYTVKVPVFGHCGSSTIKGFDAVHAGNTGNCISSLSLRFGYRVLGIIWSVMIVVNNIRKTSSYNADWRIFRRFLCYKNQIYKRLNRPKENYKPGLENISSATLFGFLAQQQTSQNIFLYSVYFRVL